MRPILPGIQAGVSVADRLLEERRARRRAGDPRFTDDGRAIVRRLIAGDLAVEFGRSLDEISEADPLLSGHDCQDGHDCHDGHG